MSEWLRTWIEKEQRHRTVNQGVAFVCPEKMDSIDIPAMDLLNFCPLCGEKLGEITKIDNNENSSWEH